MIGCLASRRNLKVKSPNSDRDSLKARPHIVENLLEGFLVVPMLAEKCPYPFGVDVGYMLRHSPGIDGDIFGPGDSFGPVGQVILSVPLPYVDGGELYVAHRLYSSFELLEVGEQIHNDNLV